MRTDYKGQGPKEGTSSEATVGIQEEVIEDEFMLAAVKRMLNGQSLSVF